MPTHLVACFFAGIFLTNAIPHFVCGVIGQPFQTPFAKPSGKGLSSATVNFVWGFVNLVAFYFLTARVVVFDPRNMTQMLAFGFGVFILGMFCAHHFGKLHDGRSPKESQVG